MSYRLRTIDASDVNRLEPLYRALAHHHNEVSTYFAGSFPTLPITAQLQECAGDLAAGTAEVAVAEEEGGSIIGFCKVDIDGTQGYIDELAVATERRNQGVGTALMDWAERVFAQRGVRQVELRVVVGNNDAQRFYERHGFRPSVLEMKRTLVDVERFVRAQEGGVYEQALAEIRAGRKQGHWIWFIFPQVKGLGRSSTASYYGIGSRAELNAYIAHPLLREHLLEITRAFLALPEDDPVAVLGSIDALKVRSCMTLFEPTGADPVFGAVLDKYYRGSRDELTLRIVAQ